MLRMIGRQTGTVGKVKKHRRRERERLIFRLAKKLEMRVLRCTNAEDESNTSFRPESLATELFSLARVLQATIATIIAILQCRCCWTSCGCGEAFDALSEASCTTHAPSRRRRDSRTEKVFQKIFTLVEISCEQGAIASSYKSAVYRIIHRNTGFSFEIGSREAKASH